MPAQPAARILGACVTIALLVSAVYAQDAPAPQGGGQTPAPPQPNPQPQPRPNVNPIPQPRQPDPNQGVSIRGRIITDVHGGPPIIEVRFETDGGQPLGFAYADSVGEFNFQKQGIGTDQTIYVVVNLEGYKPYRERLFGAFGNGNFGSSLTIFLEREGATATTRGGAPVVDLKQLRAKIPGKAVDEYEKATKEAAKGNRGKAVEGLQRAIKLAPDFYEAQYTLGVQYLALEKYDDAESALVRARDLSPKAPEPLVNLGRLYYQRGETQSDAGKREEAAATFQKSADALEEAIRQNPLSASAHSSLGAALYKIASYERAETILKKALELDENEHNARLMLLNVYTKGARYSDALEQANIYLAKNPRAPQRASLEAIKQQIEKALAK
jgi:Flp pilus assembly protein TadD